MTRRRLAVHDLGRRDYASVLELQRRLARERRDETLEDDLLLLVEHEPVITLGRGSDEAHVLSRSHPSGSIEVVEVERGGDVTYHGPGQLVGYPILDLHGYRLDLHWYLRRLEEVLLRAIGEAGLPGFRVEGYTGVWTGDPGATPTPDDDGFATVPAGRAAPLVASGAIRKIASIGVHASRWVTWHGFALNVTEAPLAAFPAIVPCGIDGVHMTSLAREGSVTGMEDAKGSVLRGFEAAFGCLAEPTDGLSAGPGDARARRRTRG